MTAQAFRPHVHRHVRAAGASERHSRIRARRRRRRTTTPAGRSRSRWACSSIASSSRSPARSRRSPTGTSTPPAGTGRDVADARAAYSIEPRVERRVPRGESAAGRGRVVSARPTTTVLRRHVGTATVGARCRQIATELGVHVRRRRHGRRRPRARLRAPRIGLWDQYGGSMTSGWTRWILEQFEFPFAARVRAGARRRQSEREVRRARVRRRRDPARGSGRADAAAVAARPIASDVPAGVSRSQLGRVTAERTLPQIRAFIESGGTVDRDRRARPPNLAAHLKLPVENHLVENGAPLPRTKFFVPGSVLGGARRHQPPARRRHARAHRRLLRQQPGVQARPGAAAAGVRVDREVRQRDAAAQRLGVGPAVSRGRRRRARGAASARAASLLFGPEILQRAQPHGTFKLLFNGIFASVAR